MANDQSPIASFGLIADPQWMDADNGNVEGRCQRYREAPRKLSEAVDAFKAAKDQLQGVLVLGDFINGRADEVTTHAEFEQVASIMDRLEDLPAWHVLGNHDINYISRNAWLSRLKCGTAYRSLALAPGWRLVILDTCELCLKSGLPEDSQAMQEAKAYWEANPMSDENPQMSDWNGGLTAEQLSWLEGELASASRAGDKVIVASHHPIGERSARATHMAWNWKEIQRVLIRSGCVVLAFAGHDHMGGYEQHSHTHFVTVEAMLEAPEDSNAYATVNIYPDYLEIKGVGTVTSRKLAIATA